VYDPGLAVAEPIQFGGCLMAQLGAFARIKHSGPQLRLTL